MASIREGGCLCSAVRYRAHGDPSRTVVCHCKFCQRCTGSAFAVWPTFDDTAWIAVDRHVWTRSRQHWVPVPAGVASFERSSSAS